MMKRTTTLSILRNMSLFTARRLRLPPCNNPTPSPSLSASTAPTRFFSSRNTPADQPHFSHTNSNSTNNNENNPIGVEDISNEELKRRVAKLQEGDDEAIPSMFEAILQRYLTGKPIEDDEELMKEILGKGTRSEEDDDNDDDDDDDGDYSYSEGMSDTDDDK